MVAVSGEGQWAQGDDKMNWNKLPLGMMRLDELLAILESLRFTMHRANRGGNPEYVAGFDDALSAVAQAAGLREHFEPLSIELVTRLNSGSTQ